MWNIPSIWFSSSQGGTSPAWIRLSKIENKKGSRGNMSAYGKQECTVGSKRETGELGNASAAVTGLSTTKHPLNNSVINSPRRLRRPVPPPPLPRHSPSFRRMPSRIRLQGRRIREEGACGSRSFHPPPFLFSLPLYSSLLTFNVRIFFCSPAIILASASTKLLGTWWTSFN